MSTSAVQVLGLRAAGLTFSAAIFLGTVGCEADTLTAVERTHAENTESHAESDAPSFVIDPATAVLDSSVGRGLITCSRTSGGIGTAPDPLYVLDGEIVDPLPSFDGLKIERIQIYKGDDAVERYGSRGENGVIEVTTR